MPFRERLAELLLQKKMRAADLARVSHISQATISDYLSGKKEPRAQTCILLAGVFGVSVDYLLDISGAWDRQGESLPVICLEEAESALLKGVSRFYLTISGDDMEPELRRGDLVLIKAGHTPDDGDIILVSLDGQALAPRRCHIEGDRLVLHPANPAYPPLVLVGAERDRLRFLGRVEELVRKL